MNRPADTDQLDTKFPKTALRLVLLVCALPFLLNVVGVSFASFAAPIDASALSAMDQHQAVDAVAPVALREFYAHHPRVVCGLLGDAYLHSGVCALPDDS